MRLRAVCLICFWSLLSGCEISSPDERGRYLFADDVRFQRQNFDINLYRGLLYIKTANQNGEFRRYLIDSFRNLGLFKQILGKRDLEILVFERNLADAIPNVSDMVALHHLEKNIGGFLVVEYNYRSAGGYSYEARLKALDPKTGNLLLDLYYRAFAGSIKSDLHEPLFEAFKVWASGRSVPVRDARRSGS